MTPAELQALATDLIHETARNVSDSLIKAALAREGMSKRDLEEWGADTIAELIGNSNITVDWTADVLPAGCREEPT